MNTFVPSLAATTALNARMIFVTELARRLHQYGTAAPRLEDAISRVAQRLRIRAEIWSSPTAIIVSFADLAQGEETLAQVTEVIRLVPGDVNLTRLCEADAVANGVIDGDISIEDGARQLRLMARSPSTSQRVNMMIGFGLTAGAFAVLLRSSFAEAVSSTAIGIVIGMVMLFTAGRPRLAPASEALSGIAATLLATLIAIWVWPLHVNLVILTSLIVLVPGMALTTAVRELSAQHLASGVSRLFGSFTVFLKLIFGVVTVNAIMGWFGVRLPSLVSIPAPQWMQWPALVLGGLGVAMVFLAERRDWPLVALSAMVGYLSAHYVGLALGAGTGVFAGGLLLGATSNVYARVMRRPGALIREPGIILLVPGSVGFRTITYLAGNNVDTGTHTAILLVTLVVALVAGLLFGDLLVPPRQSL